MDIVMVHKQKNSDEAKYAIKSLRNIDHENIYVIGDPVESAIHIPHIKHSWSHYSKYHNQISKYLQICNDDRISDEFIATNDDFFCMKKWEPINYNRGKLSDHIKTRRSYDAYGRSLRLTERWLQLRNYPTLSYELHIPFIFNKSKLHDLILSLDMRQSKLWQIRTLYGNMYNVDTETIQDVKNPFDPKDMALISTSEQTFKTQLGVFIKSNL